MKLADLYVGMIVEELMCNGPIGSGVVTPMRWQRARVTAIVRRKSKADPKGHVKVDVLREDGGVEVHDEIPIHQLSKYLRLLPEPNLDAIVRELGGVNIGVADWLPEGPGFEASIDVPEVGDYAVGFGLTVLAAVQEAAKNARNRDVRK